MKKLILLLCAFMAIATTAQTTPTYKTIKLTGTTEGGTNDDILTIGADKVVKKVAKSSLAIGGGTAPLKFDTAYSAVWNNGKGDIATNTSFGNGALQRNSLGGQNTVYGVLALNNNVDGSSNSAYGYQSLYSTQNGYSNSAYGIESLYSNTSGWSNVGIGTQALYYNTTGSNNVAIGPFAGKSDSFINDNTKCDTSIFIGLYSRPRANNETNQIVIGFGANGAGSNTATLGSTDIVKTVLRGTINVAGLPVYADNAASITGGLIVGDMYKTSTGELRVTY